MSKNLRETFVCSAKFYLTFLRLITFLNFFLFPLFAHHHPHWLEAAHESSKPASVTHQTIGIQPVSHLDQEVSFKTSHRVYS